MITGYYALAQQDSVIAKKDSALPHTGANPAVVTHADSVAIIKQQREQFLADSFAMKWLMVDSLQHYDVLKAANDSTFTDIGILLKIPAKKNEQLRTGDARNYRSPWLIAIIIGLLIYTALLNLFFNKDLKMVIQSFYNKRAVSQQDKEGGVINSWAFIGMFLLFSLTFGLFLYQLTVFYGVAYTITGFRLFVFLSVLIGLLFALKFLILKLIGFIFDINKIVSEYIGILNLTYFNIAFVFLSVVICFSLLSDRYIQVLLIFTLALIAVIFAWQYLRNSVNIISNFRFHKFYLFIYLCALEICPILILIKALNI
ncbi:DUF4271 domain-containing protein [Mucilaginibacter sp. BJC16-A38]|uniref:DUF4271 domain-containing protein n=1 Tax=Mucilaginibacter phenanthrenivorans TaxID=1234842 RepID=UPI0021581732|nr:DUF4271 domain-containing protein [Mucilaginibacter phenanthrenivorans]MCR8558678.1 DUF4271 domain-containing protein [Mucilaginibacter phenanthrenivorans]